MATTNQALDSTSKTLIDAIIQSATDTKKTKERSSNRKKLETRRAIEDYLESRRMKQDLDDYFLED